MPRLGDEEMKATLRRYLASAPGSRRLRRKVRRLYRVWLLRRRGLPHAEISRRTGRRYPGAARRDLMELSVLLDHIRRNGR